MRSTVFLNRYASFNSINVLTAPAGLSVLLPKANAMFYGRIMNNLGMPLANVPFAAHDGPDSPSFLEGGGFSDANGYYTVAVLAETKQWDFGSFPSVAPALANYIVSQGQGGVFSIGQTILQNFTALPTTARISGQVKDNVGNPVTGRGVFGNANIGGLNYGSYVDTDDSGNYTFAVASGQWSVQFDANDLAKSGLVDLFGPHVVNIPPTNALLNIPVYPTGASALSAPQRTSPSQASLSVNGSISTTYTLQVSTNLSSTNWSSLFSFQLTSNPFQVMDSQATNQQRFYRLLKN
jgi:hypothetical protein